MAAMPNVPYRGAYSAVQPPTAPRNGLGTAALVLGIIGLLTFFTVIGGFGCGVLALIFGIIGFRRTRRGQATNAGASITGIVLGVLALLLTTLATVGVVTLMHSKSYHDYQQCLDRATSTAEQHACATQFKRDFSQR